MTEAHTDNGTWTRILAGIGLVLAVLAAHFYMPSQTPALTSEAIRSLHAPGFGLVSILILKLGQFTGSPLGRYGKAAALTMLLAVVAEAVQFFGAREAEIMDLVADALGIVGFLGCAAALDRGVRSVLGTPGVILLALVSVPAFAAAVAPTGWLTYALVMRDRAFPQLLSFEHHWERTYANGIDVDYEVLSAPPGWPDGSGNIARIHSSGRYALMLRLAPKKDWSDYVAVSFVAATTDGESRRIAVGLWGLRPADRSQAGRYYTTVRIDGIPARHCILFDRLPDESSDRPFDLRNVSELLIGASTKEVGITIFVDDFRLDKSSEDCDTK